MTQDANDLPLRCRCGHVRGVANEVAHKEGKGAIKWTRLSCRTFAANAVRLQLHALAYNLGNPFAKPPAVLGRLKAVERILE